MIMIFNVSQLNVWYIIYKANAFCFKFWVGVWFLWGLEYRVPSKKVKISAFGVLRVQSSHHLRWNRRVLAEEYPFWNWTQRILQVSKSVWFTTWQRDQFLSPDPKALSSNHCNPVCQVCHLLLALKVAPESLGYYASPLWLFLHKTRGYWFPLEWKAL